MLNILNQCKTTLWTHAVYACKIKSKCCQVTVLYTKCPIQSRRVAYKWQTTISTKSSDIAFLHSDILNVKTKKASHQEPGRRPKTGVLGRTGERLEARRRWIKGGKFCSRQPSALIFPFHFILRTLSDSFS